MAKKKKMKAAPAPAKQATPSVHDRRTTDLLRNAKVAPVEVDDPHALEPGDKLIVMRSLRDDPLAAMHALGQVDECQYAAGRHWQMALEFAEVGSVKAIDPGKEAVDGGQLADPISERQQKAIGDLRRVDEALGSEGAELLRDILAKRMTVQIAAARRGYVSEAARKYVGARFRECLDTAAYVLGYSTGRTKKEVQIERPRRSRFVSRETTTA